MKRHAPAAASAPEPARLGAELRDARLALGLSVEDLARSLRIRRAYLEALEEGRLAGLPVPAYATGFVRAYARALGLDEAETVRRFRAAVGPQAARPGDLVFPEPVPDRGAPTGATILLGALLALGAYIGWYAWSGTGERLVDAVPPPPAIGEAAALAPPNPANAQASPAPAPALPQAPGPDAMPAAQPAPPAIAAPDSPAPPDAGRIVLRARSEAWIQVRDRQGGPVLVNRLLRPGESWQAPKEGLLLTTGNADGLEVLVDGEAVAGLGPGRTVRRDLLLDPERLKAGLPPLAAAGRAAPP
ncbi:helix-turn-helix domain-containing protein [Roseicella sp. DB1501]|uniref:helix-turn-helix domain-containing protein n=1 Tax=Roseicella sp. DB1501 TaxID=2730925 RepID=UPI0014927C2D|nr:helix-turn-helix domain-containing protein [Roseicella sp. DB1501]NOG73778.1 helix-turn-helix domain-containing protein [Roseicella sp. DB1501]